jgi:ABC-type transport system substrate-binding protein
VGTNYSNYNSSIADFAINAAQVARTDEERAARYDDFLRQWVNDAPAVALYSPMLYYASSQNIDTFSVGSVVDASWRFSGIADWTVLSRPVFKTL